MALTALTRELLCRWRARAEVIKTGTFDPKNPQHWEKVDKVHKANLERS